MGDQPGQHAWHYLAPWQQLPDGNFISLMKFTNAPGQFGRITDPISGVFYNVYNFDFMNIFPFPTDTATNGLLLPYLAFNYLGQLTDDGINPASRDAYIPLAQGSVMPAINPGNKTFQIDNPTKIGNPDILEKPPGNSTNISYNIVHVDRLTGRAVLEYHKMGP
jgi:hypothetical protein